jgi:hypothetical protein
MRKARFYRLSMEPVYEKLSWPGLRAKDHLSRVVTRSVKEAKEARERDMWAEKQIARVLENVPAKTAMKLFFSEMRRRGGRVPKLAKTLLNLLLD